MAVRSRLHFFFAAFFQKVAPEMRPLAGQIEQGFQKAIAGITVRHDLLVPRVGFVFPLSAKVFLGHRARSRWREDIKPHHARGHRNSAALPIHLAVVADFNDEHKQVVVTDQIQNAVIAIRRRKIS